MLKWLFRSIVICAALFLALPTLVSNRRLTEIALSYFGKGKVDHIQLRWISPQKVEGFEFVGHDGVKVSAHSAEIHIPLIDIITQNFRRGKINLHNGYFEKNGEQVSIDTLSITRNKTRFECTGNGLANEIPWNIEWKHLFDTSLIGKVNLKQFPLHLVEPFKQLGTVDIQTDIAINEKATWYIDLNTKAFHFSSTVDNRGKYRLDLFNTSNPPKGKNRYVEGTVSIFGDTPLKDSSIAIDASSGDLTFEKAALSLKSEVLTLEHPITFDFGGIHGHFSHFTLPFHQLQNLKFDGSGTIRNFEFFSAKSQEIQFIAHIDTLKRVNLNVLAEEFQSSGSLSLSKKSMVTGDFKWKERNRLGGFAKFSLHKNRDWKGSIAITELPMHFAEQFIHTADLDEVFGDRITLFTRFQVGKKLSYFDFKAKAERFDLAGKFSYRDGILSLYKGRSNTNLTITKESYPHMLRLLGQKEVKDPFSLLRAAHINGNLFAMQIPATSHDMYQIPKNLAPFKEWYLTADLQLSHFSFFDPVTQSKTTVRESLATLHRDKKTDLELHVRSKAFTRAVKDQWHLFKNREGWANIDLKMESLIKRKGYVNIDIHRYPLVFIDLVRTFSDSHKMRIAKPLGYRASARVDTTFNGGNGPLKAWFHSPYINGSLNGEIKDGIFTPHHAIKGQLNLSQDFSRFLLANTNPLKLENVRSATPIALTIQKDGTSIPLLPFNFNGMQAPNIDVKIGRVECQNSGSLSLTMGLLKAKKGSDLDIQFAPFEMHMQDGVLDIDRTEMLISNSHEIATWGKIDFPKDHVDMVVGLTRQSLKKAFFLNNLPKNYVLQIPLSGPIDDVNLNTSEAATKITLLLAWDKKALIAGAAAGPIGFAIGEVLSKVGSVLPDFTSTAPPPKHPFPWEEKKVQNKFTLFNRKQGKGAEDTSIEPSSETSSSKEQSNQQ